MICAAGWPDSRERRSREPLKPQILFSDDRTIKYLGTFMRKYYFKLFFGLWDADMSPQVRVHGYTLANGIISNKELCCWIPLCQLFIAKVISLNLLYPSSSYGGYKRSSFSCFEAQVAVIMRVNPQSNHYITISLYIGNICSKGCNKNKFVFRLTFLMLISDRNYVNLYIRRKLNFTGTSFIIYWTSKQVATFL